MGYRGGSAWLSCLRVPMGCIDGFVPSCYIKKVPRVQFSLPVVSCKQFLPEDLDSVNRAYLAEMVRATFPRKGMRTRRTKRSAPVLARCHRRFSTTDRVVQYSPLI
jgi:hypothetical protein